jgi:hypothetical protein
MRQPIDWLKVSIEHGFDSPESMFRQYFIEERLTLVQIGKIIKVSDVCISKQMTKLGIKIGRIPGKINGFYICKWCLNKFEGDQRNVCCTNPECVKKQTQKDKRKAIEYRKGVVQRKKSSKNKCKICGNDKGINKYWCNTCLSLIGVGMIGEDI